MTNIQELIIAVSRAYASGNEIFMDNSQIAIADEYLKQAYKLCVPANNEFKTLIATIADLTKRIEALEADYDRRQGDGR